MTRNRCAENQFPHFLRFHSQIPRTIFRLAREFAGLRYISQKYTTEIQEEEYQKALDVAEFWGTGPYHGHSWGSENPSP